MRIFELRLRTILERNVPYFSENEGGVLVYNLLAFCLLAVISVSILQSSWNFQVVIENKNLEFDYNALCV